MPDFDQRLAHFLDEEGIAVGFAIDAVEKFRRDLFLKQRRQQIAGLIAIEAGQLQARRQPLAVEVEQHFVERARFAQFDFAIGQHDQHAQGAHAPRQVMQQEQTAAVRPLRIVDEEQHRRAFAEQREEGRDVIEDALALGLRFEQQIGWNIGISARAGPGRW